MAQSDSKPRQRGKPRLIASVRFQSTGKLYHFDASRVDLEPTDFVVVETARGQQLGQVVSLQPPQEDDKRGYKPVKRRATSADLAIRQKWQQREVEALETARETARQTGEPIKIVTAEYTFDGKRLTLLYVSEDKNLQVRKLQQRLKHELNIHVDLRRIGPRDQAKLMDGYGACGEPRCCARFLTEFHPVSIKMAKTQGVSLNPSEITGMCGRLRCCLVYENEQYAQACKMMPRRKKRVRTPHGEGKVVDLLPLRGVVVVQIEDQRVEVPAEQVELITT